MKNILVLGKNGQIGWELLDTLKSLGHVTALDRVSANLSQPDHLVKAIRNIKPEIIVNAAAYTAVDKAESEVDLAMLINGTAPGIIAEEAKRLDAIFVHYSTDYVFDGKAKSPYRETDFAQPINHYGRSKLAGEQAIQTTGCKHIILRTSWVYGLRGNNFFLTMLRLAKEKQVIRVVNDQIGAPTWSKNIAKKTAEILKYILKSPSDMWGIYHLSAAGQTSWYEFAEAIFHQYKQSNSTTFQSLELIAISSEQYPMIAQRPHYSVLSNEKLTQTFSITMPKWETALQQCLAYT